VSPAEYRAGVTGRGCHGCGYGGGQAHCHLCHETNPPDLLDHIRIQHPDAWGDGPQRWPDGETVIVDTTLEPGDFR
jgi:hypothetical protein